jgi:hypothetical protein
MDVCEGAWTELTRMCDRTPQQVTERLDRLIKEIREVQRPHMDGSKAVDVVVVGAHSFRLELLTRSN